MTMGALKVGPEHINVLPTCDFQHSESRLVAAELLVATEQTSAHGTFLPMKRNSWFKPLKTATINPLRLFSNLQDNKEQFFKRYSFSPYHKYLKCPPCIVEPCQAHVDNVRDKPLAWKDGASTYTTEMGLIWVFTGEQWSIPTIPCKPFIWKM